MPRRNIHRTTREKPLARPKQFAFFMRKTGEGYRFEPTPKKYKYFISGNAPIENGHKNLMVETNSPFEIKGIEDLRTIAASIEESFDLDTNTFMIMNYKLMEVGYHSIKQKEEVEWTK